MRFLSAPHGFRVLLGLSALSACLALAACDWGGPVRIGFCGPLTGRWSDLGVQGRNGATLAVEDLNARGGIAGRRVELVVADKGEAPDAAPAAVRELDRKGAAVLVGLMTSAAALAGLPEAEKAGLAVVSPTAATTELSGLADGFFRVIPDAAAYAQFQADLAARQGLRRVLAVLDQGNAGFTEPYAQAFGLTLAAAGGQMAGTVRLSPGSEADLQGLARSAAAANATALLALLPARSLARLALGLPALAPRLAVYTAMWGFNNEFLEMAGRQAAGVTSCLIYPFDAPPPAMAGFMAQFRSRFGHEPASSALLAYEAVTAAALALDRTRGSRTGLVEALAGLGPIPGLTGPLRFDAEGDVDRPMYWAEVRDGRIVTQEAGRD